MSYRSQHGSIGTRGFSLRTGIPGLSYRRSWGKNAGAAALIVLAVVIAFGVLAVALRILLFVIPLLWSCLAWIALTLYDLCIYAVGRMKMPQSNPAVAPQIPNRSSHLRDTIIGVAVCGIVYLLFAHWTSKAQLTAGQPAAAASEKTIQSGHTEANASAPIKSTRPHRAKSTFPTTAKAKTQPSATEAGPVPPKPLPPPQSDDLVDVRTADAAAAARIETYCAGATAQATSRRDEILARCRHDEAAAWTRLVPQNEFPTLPPAIRETCTSPPFPASFVAEEACARYETSSDPTR